MAKKRKSPVKTEPTFHPGDRVSTEHGDGTIVQEVKNLYLLRPGAAFAVELDNGDTVDINENDMKAII